MTHPTTYCTRGHRACPCTSTCESPAHCKAWQPGASDADTKPPTQRWGAAALVAIFAACTAAALVMTCAGRS